MLKQIITIIILAFDITIGSLIFVLMWFLLAQCILDHRGNTSIIRLLFNHTIGYIVYIALLPLWAILVILNIFTNIINVSFIILGLLWVVLFFFDYFLMLIIPAIIESRSKNQSNITTNIPPEPSINETTMSPKSREVMELLQKGHSFDEVWDIMARKRKAERTINDKCRYLLTEVSINIGNLLFGWM